MRQPLVDFGKGFAKLSIGSERRGIDLGGQIPLLRFGAGYALIQLLRNLNEAAAVDLAIPLQLAQLAAQFQEGGQQVIDVLALQRLARRQGMTKAVLQQFQPAGEFGQLLVIEVVDILEISIEGIKEA